MFIWFALVVRPRSSSTPSAYINRNLISILFTFDAQHMEYYGASAAAGAVHHHMRAH